MAHLLVSVDGPSGRHDLSVPDDAPLEELLPVIVRACEGDGTEAGGWRLAPQGAAPVRPGQTLGQLGLFDGAVLVLSAPEPRPTLQAPARPPRIESMSDRDYLRTLDAAIAAPRGPRSAVIAIAGAQPGSGATTVTALLALALSDLRDERVVAVDANPRSGALGHWLVPDGAVAGDVYGSLFSPGVTPDQVSRALVAAGPRLSVLAAPIDPSMVRAAEEAHWGRLVEHARRLHHVVIVDCGTRRAADWADRVVLVNRFGQNLVAAPGIRIPTVTITNFAPRRHRIRGSQITLAIEPAAAARLKRRGFAWADAPPAWQEAVREIAAVLLAGS